MARLPTVAIIGRPNTGKSTLFNAIVGKRRAIVSDVAGTTRDHVACRVEHEKADWLLLDTGGIGGGSDDKELESDVSLQSRIAIEHADLIVFTLDAQEELTKSDFAVVDMLRKKRKRHVPVIIAATKCDSAASGEARAAQYHALGIAEDVIAVSAVHRLGVDDLMDAVDKRLADLHFGKVPVDPSDARPRVAIVGRPNVGKSSIINALMSEPQREISPRIVSDVPGTTRDPSDSVIRFEERDYVFVDTAGLRRPARIDEDSIESLASLKSIQAIEESSIVVLVLDAHELTSRQEKRIAGMAIDEGKGLIIMLNKSDTLKGAERDERMAELNAQLPFCRFAPKLFASAKTRDGLLKLFPLIDMVHENLRRRIATKDLRRWYEDAVHRLPARALAQAKHLTQAEGIPPTFVLFVRDPRTVHPTHVRYLDGSLRSTFAFDGAPIRWVLKGRERA